MEFQFHSSFQDVQGPGQMEKDLIPLWGCVNQAPVTDGASGKLSGIPITYNATCHGWDTLTVHPGRACQNSDTWFGSEAEKC